MSNVSRDISTIILRFRDLVIDTIPEHKTKIDTIGYVWWGWWDKNQETIPFQVFKHLRQKAKDTDSEFEMYLYDSGNNIIYPVICKDIRYNTDAEKMPTPAKKATPRYYNASKYKAWFKFTSISGPLDADEADTLLQEYSYVEVDDFFLNNSNEDFKSFDNKMVFGCDELYGQQRTIYFLSKRSSTDKQHQIQMYSPDIHTKTSIDDSYTELETGDILWLSDLHFSKDHHAFLDKKYEDNSLSTVLIENLNDLDIQPSGTIISGDITFQATTSEFKLAKKFTEDINIKYHLDGSRYIICPGNHDIAYTTDSSDKGTQISVAFDEAKKNYVQFIKDVCNVNPVDKLYSIKKFLTPELKPIEIIAFNSNYLQQQKGVFQGMGYVGNNQMREITAALNNKNSSKKPFRILILHHHLVQVLTEEPGLERYSITLDAASISAFIKKHNIKLVLHGHAHKSFTEMKTLQNGNNHNVQIVGLGSTGVTRDYIPGTEPNSFGHLYFSSTNIKVTIYSIDPNGEPSQELKSVFIDY